MKRLLATLVLGLALGGGEIVRALPGQLLQQYDFEPGSGALPGWGAGYQGEYFALAHWTEPFAVFPEKGDAHSGSASLRVSITKATGAPLLVNSPLIPLEGSRGVKIRFFVRTVNLPDGTLSFSVLEKDKGGKVLQFLGGGRSATAVPSGPEWHEAAMEGTTESASTAALTLLFRIEPAGAPASLWIDDISVESVP